MSYEIIQNSENFLQTELADLGFRLFTTLRTHSIPAKSEEARKNNWNVEPAILHLDKHLKRVSTSNNELKLTDFDASRAEKSILEYLQNSFYQKKQIESHASIKLVLSPSGVRVLIDEYAAKWPEDTVADLVSYKGERILPEHKTTSAATSVLARRFAKESNADEAILVDRNNIVREGAWSNVFWFDKNSRLHTTANSVLPGVTRDILMSLEETELVETTYEEFLETAEEIFLSQSTAGITPAKSFDGKLLSIERTTALRSNFERYIDDKAETIFP